MLQNLLAPGLKIIGAVVDGIPNTYVPSQDLETQVSGLALRTVLIASVILIATVCLAALLKGRAPRLKLPLFLIIAFTMVASTLLLVVSTVYLNVKSDSGGPVHWHADIEYWVCGNQMELRDPTGTLSNKIGTATLHEHDDQRIHLEGVVVKKREDASLGKFMHVIDGTVTDDALVIPLNDTGYFENAVDGDGPNDSRSDEVLDYVVKDETGAKFLKVVDGQTCGDQAAETQVFVFNYDEKAKTYTQRKVSHPQDYVISPEPNVPPADCVIFEFDVAKERTDKICRQYGIRDVELCTKFGVTADQREICEIREEKTAQPTVETIEAEENTHESDEPEHTQEEEAL